MNFKLLFLFAVLFLIGCSSRELTTQHKTAYEKFISEVSLKANLEFLASDELEGREAATRGENIASLFIANQLTKYGVKPFGDNGTYFQSFHVISRIIDTLSYIKVFNETGDEVLSTNYLNGFFRAARGFNDYDLICNIVFAGYGIEADEIGYNDYKNADVNGKFAVVLSGTPQGEAAEFFEQRQNRKYSEINYKIETAQKHGVSGIFFIAPEDVIEKWDRYQKYLKIPSITLLEDLEKDSLRKETIPAFTINSETAEMIFEGSGFSLDEILAKSISGEQLNSFLLTNSIKLKVSILSESKTARNVIGIIEGHDELLKNEFVAVSAHYDHVGLINGEVYNGADDDGSGTVVVLETAKAFSIKPDNRRSVLFILHTAEEKGLLGSLYLTNNYTWIGDISALVNLDMVGRGHEDSIFVIGSKKISSQLYDLIKNVNAETSNFYFNYKFDDPADPNRYYYRSDHYHYANKNIPIAFFFDDMREDYHKPTDTPDKINYKKLLRMSELTYNVLKAVANLDAKVRLDEFPTE
jgi:hypothetical protein